MALGRCNLDYLPSYDSEQKISYLLMALCDFRTGSTAHQWVKPDMGRLVLETALRGGRITGDVCIQLFFLMLVTSLVPGGATRTKKKKIGNTAPHLERSPPFKLISPPFCRFLIQSGFHVLFRFWTQLTL